MIPPPQSVTLGQGKNTAGLKSIDQVANRKKKQLVNQLVNKPVRQLPGQSVSQSMTQSPRQGPVSKLSPLTVVKDVPSDSMNSYGNVQVLLRRFICHYSSPPASVGSLLNPPLQGKASKAVSHYNMLLVLSWRLTRYRQTARAQFGSLAYTLENTVLIFAHTSSQEQPTECGQKYTN